MADQQTQPNIAIRGAKVIGAGFKGVGHALANDLLSRTGSLGGHITSHMSGQISNSGAAKLQQKTNATNNVKAIVGSDPIKALDSMNRQIIGALSSLESTVAQSGSTNYQVQSAILSQINQTNKILAGLNNIENNNSSSNSNNKSGSGFVQNLEDAATNPVVDTILGGSLLKKLFGRSAGASISGSLGGIFSGITKILNPITLAAGYEASQLYQHPGDILSHLNPFGNNEERSKELWKRDNPDSPYPGDTTNEKKIIGNSITKDKEIDIDNLTYKSTVIKFEAAQILFNGMIAGAGGGNVQQNQNGGSSYSGNSNGGSPTNNNSGFSSATQSTNIGGNSSRGSSINNSGNIGDNSTGGSTTFTPPKGFYLGDNNSTPIGQVGSNGKMNFGSVPSGLDAFMGGAYDESVMGQHNYNGVNSKGALPSFVTQGGNLPLSISNQNSNSKLSYSGDVKGTGGISVDKIKIAMSASATEFMKHGYTPEQANRAAAALIGNAMHESGLNPNAIHDNGHGLGIYGAGNARKNDMVDWIQQQGGNPRDLSWQAKFQAHEAIEDPHRLAWTSSQDKNIFEQMVKTGASPSDLAHFYHVRNERPQSLNTDSNRRNFATSISGLNYDQKQRDDIPDNTSNIKPYAIAHDSLGNPVPTDSKGRVIPTAQQSTNFDNYKPSLGTITPNSSPLNLEDPNINKQLPVGPQPQPAIQAQPSIPLQAQPITSSMPSNLADIPVPKPPSQYNPYGNIDSSYQFQDMDNIASKTDDMVNKSIDNQVNQNRDNTPTNGGSVTVNNNNTVGDNNGNQVGFAPLRHSEDEYTKYHESDD